MGIYAYDETIKACQSCLLCRHACTVTNVTFLDTTLPRGKALLLHATEKGLLDWDRRVVEVMYQCTNCHLCREWCVKGWDIAPLMLAARSEITGKGLEPGSVQNVREMVLKSGNPYGETGSPFEQWVEQFSLPEKAPLLYLAGSTAGYRQLKVAQAAVEVLQRSGVAFAVLPNEPDAGELLYLLGYREDARLAARRTLERISASGAEKVVSSDPSLIEAFQHGYREWGVQPPEGLRFLHISELIAEDLAKGVIKPSRTLKISVTYHDPCLLGRELKVFDAPREVIKMLSGVELRELRLNREHSPCCGHGGGVPFTNPAIAAGAGVNAAEIVLETGAQALVTACPSCKASFSRHIQGMEVMDLAELVLLAL
jgi:Fe-S oxidoreductase